MRSAWRSRAARASNCPDSAISNCATSRSGPAVIPRPVRRFPSQLGAWSLSTLARNSRRWSSKPMESKATKDSLPAIPAKRYFTIGEVSELCGVKPHVLRYWEQEFTQLRPVKRRGNRRYYQHHEVLLIRRIRELLYEQGFTISGARNRLDESLSAAPTRAAASSRSGDGRAVNLASLKQELKSVIDLLAEKASSSAR